MFTSAVDAALPGNEAAYTDAVPPYYNGAHALFADNNPVTAASFYTSSTDGGFWNNLTKDPFSMSILLLCIVVAALFGVLTQQMRQTMQQLRTSQHLLRDITTSGSATAGNLDTAISDAVGNLCDKNQLVRLAAIQALGSMGARCSETLPRTAGILEAYVKAITADDELRRTARPEVLACLRELSVLNTTARRKNIGYVLDLAGITLTGLPLRHLDLSGADLRGARLQKAVLSHVSLEGSQLRGANLQAAELRHCRVGGATVDGSNWQGTRYNDCDGIEEIPAGLFSGEAFRTVVSPGTAGKRQSVRQDDHLLHLQPPLDKTKLH